MTRRKDPAKPIPPVPRNLPPFEPVPVAYRADGWTPERQRAFIAALAESGYVSHAAQAVQMTFESAYQLRRRPGAESFAAAWRAALSGQAAPGEAAPPPPRPLPLTQRGLMHVLEAAARRRRAAKEASGLSDAEIDALNAAIIRGFRPVR